MIIWLNVIIFNIFSRDMTKIKLLTENLVGRESQIETLEKYINSETSEFIAVYGRRRVGKTFLIKESLRDVITFRFTGREGAMVNQQLLNFHYALMDAGGTEQVPENWIEAFRMLSQFLERKENGPKVVFIDELPWLDTSKSGFLGALEYFWNDWASYRNDVKLIVCGSATSWMLDKVINSRGGLHNRVTHRMLVSPFSLKETEDYFKFRGFLYERSEVMDAYMVFGGVAYYLSLFEREKSVAQNVNDLCFAEGGELVGEYDRLFKSLFKKSEKHASIITALSKKGIGLTRQQIVDEVGLVNNGNVSTMLRELEECEFIRSYEPFGKSSKDTLYQLIDQFTLFHFSFVKGHSKFAKNFWLKQLTTPSYSTWRGFAFEKVCLHHIDQIVVALGIDGMINTPCSWIHRVAKSAKKSEGVGAQIDLLIDRSDKVINVCEMKYCQGEFEITKTYDEKIFERIETFKKITKTRKSVVPIFVTPFGLKDNANARKIMRTVTLDKLFS